MQYRYETEPFDQPGPTRFGRTYYRDGADKPWEYRCGNTTAVGDQWFVGHPQEVLARIGVTCERKRAQDLADLIDGKLDGFTYVALACPDGSDEGIKWIMGSLAQVLKERGLGFERAHEVLPARTLGAFVQAVVVGLIDRTVARDIFAALLEEPLFETVFGTEWIVERSERTPRGEAVLIGAKRTVRVSEIAEAMLGEATLQSLLCGLGEDVTPAMIEHALAYSVARDEMGWERAILRDPFVVVAMLVQDPRFAVADTSVLDGLIDQVIAANPDQVAQVAVKPSMVQWFVGQVMRAAKGQKLPPPEVLARLKQKLGVA